MNLLYLTILFPIASFILLAFSCGRWSEKLVATIGVSSIGLSGLVTAWIVWDFFRINKTDKLVFTQILWNWISIDLFQVPIALNLDALALTMLAVVTGIGFFIHLYASWYMSGKEGYSRFFAYTNLFVANMLILVMADNLLLMFLGWEGVGFCSYLLIGFYYKNTKNGMYAIKAFITTRIGDVLLAIALFIIYNQLGSLNFYEIQILAPEKLINNSLIVAIICLMLLGGAIGKSAQIPLQTWLADAMVGPTPVSALIHSTTMVTAGVYLIIRTKVLFLMVPEILNLVGIIGATTLILASFAALVQTDIKRILAYSTMSQIGYMFLALGIKSWDAAIFHLVSHAFFKSLLFLSSGSVILACNNEQNIFKMGGLKNLIPIIYVCFLVGGASLSALPFITSGFYSKEEILWLALSDNHNMFLLAGLLGALLTSLYTFRMIFIVFHGKIQIKANNCYNIININHYLPLIVLMILSTFIGSWIKPPLIENVLFFNKFNYEYKLTLQWISSIIAVIGAYLAMMLWFSQQRLVNVIYTSFLGKILFNWLFQACGFDWLYDKIFVKPYLLITRFLSLDPIDLVINLFASLVTRIGCFLTLSENGKLHWYITSLMLGAILMLALLVFI